MPTAVITGCNSGLGFCLAQLALKQGYKTYATSRTDGPKLKELKEAGAQTSTLDVSSIDAISAFKKNFGDEPVDLLIHNAANFGGLGEHLGSLNPETIEASFRTNTFGPLFLSQALLSNLLASASSAPKQLTQIANITSRVGSIGDNSSGGMYAYRSSKAALNMIGKNMAVELKDKNVVVSLIHPGMVNTPFFNHGNDNPLAVSAEYAAEKCWEVMMKVDKESTGKNWHRDGYELPW